jgi:tRNA G18 (ribose-2'-O)-methylase SpoU
MHRGVLALATRGAEVSMDRLLEAELVVGICGVTNHDNVGGIFRNAAAFGATVLLDRASCDPLYRKSVRVSVGGALVVPFGWCADEGAMIDALGSRGYSVIALSPRGTLEIGRTPPPVGKVALLLGAEGPGLHDSTLRRCTSARIAMSKDWDSLNVAAASAIALHWMTTLA